MSCCPPSCAIPCSTPSIGLGSCGIGSGACYGGFGYGGGVPSSALGLTSGAHVACVNQLPPSELVIQPSPLVVTIPGAVLTSSCEPLAVGGYSPCSSGGYGGYLGGYKGLRGKGICGYPC